MKVVKIVVFLVLPYLTVIAQTQSRYVESFENDSEITWSFLAFDASISIVDNKLKINSNQDESIRLLPPIGAIQGDFSIKITGSKGELYGGSFGRGGLNSLIGIYVEDSLYVIYSNKITSYTNPELVWLSSYPLSDDVNTLELSVATVGDQLNITALMNDNVIYEGNILNPDPALSKGQIILDIIKGDTPIDYELDLIEINYNQYCDPNNQLTDDFSDSNTPWLKFGDNQTIGQCITVENDVMKFLHDDVEETALFVIPPIGTVGDFTFELDVNVANNDNSVFGISRFFDYLNYVTMLVDNGVLSIGYASNSYDPTMVESKQIDMNGAHKIKFSALKNNNNIDLTVWIDDVLFLSGMIENADARLFTGQFAVGFERGNSINSNISNVKIDYKSVITSLNDETNTLPVYSLKQNYPNPFNPNTIIVYSLQKESDVKILVYDVLGNLVETLLDERKPAGIYDLNYHASQLSSGVYFYSIIAGEYINTKKMLLLK